MWYPSWHQLKFPLAFVCATAIHGGLLWLPMPPAAIESQPNPPAESSAESSPEAIATIPLAALTTPTPDSLPEDPTPDPTSAPQPQPTTAPSVETTPATSPQPQAAPDPEAKTIEPQPTPDPTPDLDAKTIKPTPDPIPDPKAKTIEPTSDPTPEPREELMAGIPHLEGAESGCYGSADCHFLPGTTVRSVTQELQARLESQGYRLTSSYRDTGLRVYELSREGEPAQFLHIASDNAGRDTFYVLSAQQQTLEELRSP